MATNYGTAAGASFIPTIWSKDTTIARDNSLVLAKLVNRFDSDAKEGSAVYVPNVSTLTATYKQANTEVPQSVTTETKSTISLNKHAANRVTIEDIAAVQASYNLRSIYTKQLGKSIAKLMDSDIMALATGITQTCGSASSANTLIKSYILAGIRQLDAANVPDEDRHFCVEAYGMKDLRTMDDFIRYDSQGKAGMINGASIGNLYGVEVHRTQQVGTSAASIARGLMFHKDAFALAVQKDMRTQGDYIARELAWDVVCDCIYGAATIRADHAVQVAYGQV